MPRALIILLISIFFVTGCNIHVINYDSVNTIVDTVLYKDTPLTNTSYEGYSLYLPQGTKVVDKNDYNLKIKDNEYYYYLYVDTIAYHYKANNIGTLDESHFYTELLNNSKLFGYIDITDCGEKYFIVVMYNYAKVESYVCKDDLHNVLANICNILSSVKYNDKIIDTYVESNRDLSQEESFDIFSSKRENDNFLTYEQEYGMYVDSTDKSKNNDEDTIDLQTDN